MTHCQHKITTLCQHTQEYNLNTEEDPVLYLGSFVAYQCDDCGMLLRTEVTQEDLDKSNLPPVDVGMWEQAIHAANVRLHRDRPVNETMQFFAKALRK